MNSGNPYSLLIQSNVGAGCFPGWHQSKSIISRWNLPVPVLVPAGVDEAVQDVINEGLAEIKQRLKKEMFVFCDRLAGTGIEIQWGNALGRPDQDIGPNDCGHVGGYPPDDLVYPQNFRKNDGEIVGPLVVHLWQPKCRRSVSGMKEIVIHEFGHALGLGSHFKGFGDGPAISPTFWSVLNCLYDLPLGTDLGTLKKLSGAQ